MATEQSDWTKENLQKLFAAMKTSISEQNRMCAYSKGLKQMDWKRVAFPPFSPEACKEKWGEILQKMRKIRSLTELIAEAEDVVSNKQESEQRTEDGDGLPPKPPFNGYNLFCKEQLTSMSGVSRNSFVTVWAKRWQNLTERQKHEYRQRSKELKTQYSIKLNKYLMTLDEEEQQRILDKHGIKRPKISKRKKVECKLPGEPKMSSRSGLSIFLRDQRRLLKEKFPDSKTCFIKVIHMWKNLSNEEKEHYRKKVNENSEKYSMALQRWFQTLKPEEQKAYLTNNPKKCRYLGEIIQKFNDRKEIQLRPSDSEDEDIEDSSSDEEEDEEDEKEEEEEEDDDDITFDMY
uniref:nucleolar transcription factor 1-like n=1 Tax=Scatophagus argus TaxID=75038 RepID=UPI001ED8218D|nr:nucleolar transcription factor 1-like [Scatophagus argus]XP_046232637.1 nucleolar transcription factor 1-like [Scatophagus argus]XP_046232638.1 nucleolar transcription factor 1-like [Scatophagus argus]XP_046232639.1 nucleolar transcription factor 1-like [Scatophagus argus]XP_046232640.1 nucleolar transcription factor 1-like [Scatophagus argus]XP_046232641.1 nucleolar transcription factor 1-like [Scatophagus argus]XP_046232642.1 nucleolar transcription factor 1-like [Scatophagus argus]